MFLFNPTKFEEPCIWLGKTFINNFKPRKNFKFWEVDGLLYLTFRQLWFYLTKCKKNMLKEKLYWLDPLLSVKSEKNISTLFFIYNNFKYKKPLIKYKVKQFFNGQFFFNWGIFSSVIDCFISYIIQI